MYVYVCAYIYIYMHTTCILHVYIRIHRCMYKCVNMYILVYTYIHTFYHLFIYQISDRDWPRVPLRIRACGGGRFERAAPGVL